MRSHLAALWLCRLNPAPAAWPGCGHGHAFGLRGITDKLNLTSDQQTKVQPILDAAKPQIAAIHQEAMQKMKTVMDSTLSQIRPLLNADQQTKLDAIQKAHQDMMNAHKELHERDAGIAIPILGAMGKRRRLGNGRRRLFFVARTILPATVRTRCGEPAISDALPRER